MYLFLDESGDLGFDFSKKGTTNHFTVTILVVEARRHKLKLEKAVERTLKNKVNVGKKGKKRRNELKGIRTSLEVKNYFYRLATPANFAIYSVILNKKRVYDYLKRSKERLYNYVSRLVISEIPLMQAQTKVILTLDKRKNKAETREFNKYLLNHLEGVLPLNVPLEPYHLPSYESKGIQAADLFCWGIFRKYERNDLSWYNVFKEKIKFETVYLPEKAKNKKSFSKALFIGEP